MFITARNAEHKTVNARGVRRLPTFAYAQVDRQQMDSVLEYMESGKKEGARLCVGGGRVGDKGFFVQPTVFADVQDHMKIAKEEVVMVV